MLISIKSRDGLEKFQELVSLPNQVKELEIQDKLCKQNFHEEMKN